LLAISEYLHQSTIHANSQCMRRYRQSATSNLPMFEDPYPGKGCRFGHLLITRLHPSRPQMWVSAYTPNRAPARRRRHLILLRPAIQLLRLQPLIALLDEESAFEEFETFVDDTICTLALNLPYCCASRDKKVGKRLGRGTYIIGALIAMTAFHSFPSSGITLKSPCRKGTYSSAKCSAMERQMA
jgi:hypothetical protein